MIIGVFSSTLMYFYSIKTFPRRALKSEEIIPHEIEDTSNSILKYEDLPFCIEDFSENSEVCLQFFFECWTIEGNCRMINGDYKNFTE